MHSVISYSLIENYNTIRQGTNIISTKCFWKLVCLIAVSATALQIFTVTATAIMAASANCLQCKGSGQKCDLCMNKTDNEIVEY